MVNLYTRPIQRIWGTEKVPVTHTRARKDRNQMLEEHIRTKDYITEEEINKMSFANARRILERYTKKKGVVFDYIGDDKWVILK